MTRQRAADTADELAMQRELRCELSSRGLTKKIAREGSEHGQVTKILTDVWDKNNEPQHRMGSTGRLVDARRAAGACMPNATDLLNRGMDMGFLVDIANGKVSTHFGIDEAKIGIRKKGWEFETLPGEVVMKGPADFRLQLGASHGVRQAPRGRGWGCRAPGRRQAKVAVDEQRARDQGRPPPPACSRSWRTTRCRSRACATCSS